MSSGDFYGRKTIELGNPYFQLDCLVEGGPRLVRLIPAWLGENLFAEVPEAASRGPLGAYHFLGGHRLWIAPEDLATTYVPDDDAVSVRKISGGIKLEGGIQPETHIRKSMYVQLSSTRPFVMIKHKLENRGRKTIRVAPWALTMLRTKGTAILPQQLGNVDQAGLLPNRNISLWPYSRWDDSRLKLGEEFIRIKATNNKQPFKLGYFNPHGWLGYVFEDVLFIKRYGVNRSGEYPDLGCNSEVYTDYRFIELESLGALTDLKPGEELVHTESWEVYDLNTLPPDLPGGGSLLEILK